MVYFKFIIESENLIMAKCTYHKQLAKNKEQVKGGGWFRYDEDKKAFILGGSSYDFSYAKVEDIKKCIEDNKVYGNVRLTRNMSNHKFMYDTQTELIKLN
tara:strand:- start:3454 stop:3753 length:300 start_codon:yes stop_codon:yes gene_type:complete